MGATTMTESEIGATDRLVRHDGLDVVSVTADRLVASR